MAIAIVIAIRIVIIITITILRYIRCTLDIYASFDTVVHSTLVQRLHSSFGFDGNILTWITSYLTERSQFVKVGSASALPSNCSCGVSQWSVLGLLFFMI